MKPLASLVTVATLSAALLAGVALPAMAADTGPITISSDGIGYAKGDLDHFTGAWKLSSGDYGYCVDPNKTMAEGVKYDEPIFGTSDVASTANRQRVNYILDRWGKTTNWRQATAVQYAIWNIIATPAEWESHETTLDRLGADRGSIESLYKSYVNASKAAGRAPEAIVHLSVPNGASAGSVSVDLSIITIDNSVRRLDRGTHSITVTLNGASFSSSSIVASKTVPNGAPVTIYPTEPGVATVTARAQAAALPYSDRIKMVVAEHEQDFGVGAEYQRIALWEPATSAVTADSTKAWDTRTRFAPTVSTRTSAVSVDGPTDLTDTLTVNNDPSKPWGVGADGTATPVAIVSTLWGPFTSRAAIDAAGMSASPLDPALNVGEVTTVVTSAGTTSSPAVRVSASGLYTWTAEVDPARSPVHTASDRDYIEPWLSSFGEPEETTIVRWHPAVTTVVSKQFVQAGAKLSDSISITANRPGQKLTVVSRLYGPFESRPVVVEADDHERCSPFEPLGGPMPVAEVTTDVTGNGTFESPEVVVDDPGYYTWSETIAETETTTCWSSSFGLTSETSIAQPGRLVTPVAQLVTRNSPAAPARPSAEASVDRLPETGATLTDGQAYARLGALALALSSIGMVLLAVRQHARATASAVAA